MDMDTQRLPRRQFHAMGCDMSVVLSAPVGAQSDALLAQVPTWFAQWERMFSRFRTDSELSRVNARAGEAVAVSAEFLAMVQRALEMAERTQGLITPLVGQAVIDLGYDRDFAELPSAQSMPTYGRLNDARFGSCSLGDYQSVQCDHERLLLTIRAGSRLDLGGFVKGWCADEVVRRLGAFAPVLMDAGGDIAVSGRMMDGYAWPVAIARPFSAAEDLAVLAVEKGGVATSGRDYRRWLWHGQLQHHIIDPRTVQSAQTDVLSASVLAESAFQAESLAKLLLILGSEQAQLRWQNWSDIGVCLVLDHGETVVNEVFEHSVWH